MRRETEGAGLARGVGRPSREKLPKYVHRKVAKGRVYYDLRVPGEPRRKLPIPPGCAPRSPTFERIYEEVRYGQAPRVPAVVIGERKSPPGSLSAALAAYLGNKDAITNGGKRDVRAEKAHRDYLERFRVRYGDLPLVSIEDRHIQKELKTMTPSVQKKWLDAVRGFYRFAVDHRLAAKDATSGVKRAAVVKSRGHKTWHEEDIANYEAFWPLGSRARLAFALALYTGARVGDLIRLNRLNLRGDRIRWQPRKTRRSTGVWIDIPVHPKLRAILDAAPNTDTFVVNSRGAKWDDTAFSKWFGDTTEAAGLERLTAHGLRKAIARRLFEAGASDAEIMSVTGHSTLQEVQRYTAEFRRAAQAVSAIARLV